MSPSRNPWSAGRHEGRSFSGVGYVGLAQGRADLVDLTGQMTFPQIVIDGRSIGGFRELLEADRSGRLEQLLAA